MASPQDAPRRKKQKARATKKLAAWREKKIASTTVGNEAKADAK